MWYFQKIDPVQSVIPFKYVAFVGAGGKTSLIEYFASRLVKEGKTVAITTTTKIFVREPYQLLKNSKDQIDVTSLNRFGRTLENGKLTAVNDEDIQRIGSSYDIVLIEADGAKHRPLKFPAPYEPVIPSVAEKIYVVSGLDALFHQVQEVVFRYELFCNIAGIDGQAVVTEDVFMNFFSPSILFKGVDTGKCTIVLNKYDVLRQRSCGGIVAKGLLKNIHGPDLIVSSINHHVFYRITH